MTLSFVCRTQENHWAPEQKPSSLAGGTSRLVQPAVPTVAGTGLVQPVAKPVAKPTQDEKTENPFTKSILDEVRLNEITCTKKEYNLSNG